MDVLFLYGPPAAGKLTVAKELAGLTDLPLFHNHLFANLAAASFPFGTREYSDLAQKLRLDTLEALGKAKVKGAIMTFVYGLETYKGKSDLSAVKEMERVVHKHGGRMFFVKLTASTEEIRRRIGGKERKRMGKLASYKALLRIKKAYDLERTIPGRKSLLVDTSRLTPRGSARLIRKDLCV